MVLNSYRKSIIIILCLFVTTVFILPFTLVAKERGGGARPQDSNYGRKIMRSAKASQANTNKYGKQNQNSSSAESQKSEVTKLLQKIQQSKPGSRQRSRYERVLRKKYGLALLMVNDRETLIRSGEIIALNISEPGRRIAKELLLDHLHSYELGNIGVTIDVFKVQNSQHIASTLANLKKTDPHGQYELNMMYDASGEASTSNNNPPISSAEPKNSFTVGLVDTGVNMKHKSLQHVSITQENFGRGAEIKAKNHGTAISSIIARYGKANIFVADVFSDPTGFGDSEAIIKALNWLAEKNIGVINMSLTGPDNIVLRKAISNLTNKGHIIVAAVGNEGADGPARYPAAYDQVIGVTAVDATYNIYNKANQDTYVDISALGVDIIASATQGESTYSGTSFASAFVSGSLAMEHEKADPANAAGVIQLTMSALIDLGQVGYDTVFGFGLLTTEKYYPAGE